MSLGAVLSGVGRFCHVGKARRGEALQQHTGPAGGDGRLPARGSGPPCSFPISPSEWRRRLPVRRQESGAKLRTEQLREGKRG